MTFTFTYFASGLIVTVDRRVSSFPTLSTREFSLDFGLTVVENIVLFGLTLILSMNSTTADSSTDRGSPQRSIFKVLTVGS